MMLYTNRWVCAALGMYIMFISGTIYLFPDYSDSLRQQLNMSVGEVDFVGTMLNLGTWMAILGGFFYDRFGPRPTGVVGSLMLLCGYLLMYAACRGKVASSPSIVAVYALITGQGSGWMYTTALNTTVQNFSPRDRGKLVGMLVCCFGLCAGLFTQFHKGFFPVGGSTHGLDNTTAFLQFLSLATSATALLCTVGTNVIPDIQQRQREAEPMRANLGYALAILVALFVAASSLSETFSNVSAFDLAVALACLLPLFNLLYVGYGPVVRVWRGYQGYQAVSDKTALISDEASAAGADGDDMVGKELIPDADPARGHTSEGSVEHDLEDDEGRLIQQDDAGLFGSSDGRVQDTEKDVTSASMKGPDYLKDYSFLRTLRSFDFWIIFFIYFAGIGSGITIVNNLAELVIARISMSFDGKVITQAELPHQKDKSTLVALFSVFNTFGRLLFGYASDKFAHRLARPSWLVISTLLMGLVQVYFAFATIDMMYGGILFLGLAYGSFFCIIPTLVSEAYGVASFGANFGLQGLAPALGSELLATLSAGNSADRLQHHHFVNVTGDGTSTLHCLGEQCYYQPLLTNAGLCAAAIVAAAWLSYRNRHGTADTLLVRSRSI